jgi:hypothetical protein
VTAKCANPICPNPFHYFRSGKIDLIDWVVSGATLRGNGAREVEYFWLCGQCSANMRVTMDGYGEVVVERVAPPALKTRENSAAEQKVGAKALGTSASP